VSRAWARAIGITVFFVILVAMLAGAVLFWETYSG